ncbi:MAG: NUDIX domain-containing protein, partial [archaeon]
SWSYIIHKIFKHSYYFILMGVKRGVRGAYRKAVFVVVYRISGKKIIYLTLKRKLHWKGWEFPKGGVEGNENTTKTARREAWEESGLGVLDLKKFDISGKYKYHKIFSDRPGFFGQTYSLFAARAMDGKVKLEKREHSAYKWLEFGEAYKKLKWPNQKKCLKIVNKFLDKKFEGKNE